MTEKKDIVDELREIQRMNTTLHGAQMAARAADEIERLRGMLEVRDKLVMHYVEQRDEARREVCALFVAGDFSVHENVTKQHVAFERGWDCFKENA